MTPEHRAKLAAAAKRQWSDPDMAAKMRRGMSQARTTADRSKVARRLWRTAAYRAKMRAGQAASTGTYVTTYDDALLRGAGELPEEK